MLQSNLEELERLRAIVADMLFLARAEQGVRAPGLVASSIAQEVGKTVEFLGLLLDEAGMTVQVEGDAVAPIETSLFRRARSGDGITTVGFSVALEGRTASRGAAM